MQRIEFKNFKSIDGSFDEKIKFIKAKKLEDIKNKKLSILGKGNSISALPFNKNSVLIEP